MIPTLFSVSYAGLWGQHQLDIESFIKKAAEVPFVEMQIAYVQKLAQIAQQLGAGIVRVFTGYATAEEAYQEDWEVCVQAIRECAGRAERCGVCIGVQNHHDTGVSTDAFIEFLNDVDHPNCKAMFDPWSPALQGEDLYACARALAPRMVQTTIADYVRLKRWTYLPQLVNYRPMPAMVRAVPLGHGFIDFESFFKGLRDGGFEGPVAYEMCSPLRGGGSEANLDRTAKISLNQIRTLINPLE